MEYFVRGRKKCRCSRITRTRYCISADLRLTPGEGRGMAARKRSPGKRITARRQPPAAAAPAVAAPSYLGLTSDWYWEQDAELRFTRVVVRDGAAAEQSMAQQLIGKKRWETGVEVEDGWDAHRAVLQARAPFSDV